MGSLGALYLTRVSARAGFRHGLARFFAFEAVLVLRGGGLVEVLPEAGVLLGFALVFFVIGVWRFRYE